MCRSASSQPHRPVVDGLSRLSRPSRPFGWCLPLGGLSHPRCQGNCVCVCMHLCARFLVDSIPDTGHSHNTCLTVFEMHRVPVSVSNHSFSLPVWSSSHIPSIVPRADCTAGPHSRPQTSPLCLSSTGDGTKSKLDTWSLS